VFERARALALAFFCALRVYLTLMGFMYAA
jgi:hypothetical protein